VATRLVACVRPTTPWRAWAATSSWCCWAAWPPAGGGRRHGRERGAEHPGRAQPALPDRRRPATARPASASPCSRRPDARRTAQARRPGHVPGQGRRAQHPALLRPRHAGGRQRPLGLEPTCARPCSTASSAALPAGRRRRGPHLGVEALVRWNHPQRGHAGRVHSRWPRDRPDPAAGALGAADRLPPAGALGQRPPWPG
jgi:hypothetical protein